MGEWNITISNLTGQPDPPGETVEFMLFQTEPDPLVVNSYSSAWKAVEVQYPGKIGPVVLPSSVSFSVLDEVEGLPRQTGPIPVKFGQQIEVTQKTKAAPPSAKVLGTPQPKGEIKVTNKDGNVQPLEFALYKDGKKVVSYKSVAPADAVYLDIKPVIYIADIDGSSIKEGTDFKADAQAAKSTPFELYPDIPDIAIGIKQLPSGEIEFVKL